MATNKNAQLRYRVYDELFQNRFKRHSIESILEAVRQAAEEHGSEGVSETQFYTDINFLKSQEGGNAPIERYREGRKNFYRYAEPDFSLFKGMGLNKDEVLQLKTAMEVLTRFDGLPHFEFVSEIIARLESQLLFPQLSAKIMLFEENKDYKAVGWISDLFHYIQHQEPLKIGYRSFIEKENRDWTISPACLRQHNNRWYLMGYNHGEDFQIYTLPLDRILSVQRATEVEYHHGKEDWEEYFFDIIGVSKINGTGLEAVHLRFSEMQAPYIETKPLHPTQRFRRNDNGTAEVRLCVIPNRELANLICSFGEHVEVVAPASLRAQILARHQAAITLYKG
jgi:predicted DNA-binding transcriptional regulator YafY